MNWVIFLKVFATYWAVCISYNDLKVSLSYHPRWSKVEHQKGAMLGQLFMLTGILMGVWL